MGRYLSGAFKAASGDFILVSESNAEPVPKIFIGPNLQALKEIEVKGFRRMKDGGTSSYETSDGKLYVPSVLKPGDASWQEVALTKLSAQEVSEEIGTSNLSVQDEPLKPRTPTQRAVFSGGFGRKPS